MANAPTEYEENLRRLSQERIWKGIRILFFDKTEENRVSKEGFEQKKDRMDLVGSVFVQT